MRTLAFLEQDQERLRETLTRDLVQIVPAHSLERSVDIAMAASQAAFREFDMVMTARPANGDEYINAMGPALGIIKTRCTQVEAALRTFAVLRGYPIGETALDLQAKP